MIHLFGWVLREALLLQGGMCVSAVAWERANLKVAVMVRVNGMEW